LQDRILIFLSRGVQGGKALDEILSPRGSKKGMTKNLDLWRQVAYSKADQYSHRGIMYFIIRLLINMVAILIIAYLVPKVIQVDSWMAALVAAFLLGVANTFIRPLLVLLTLPLTLVTLGIFLLVINGLLLWLVSAVVRGFQVNGFLGALIGAILISIVSWILSRFVHS
jgi:putative membrane protein